MSQNPLRDLVVLGLGAILVACQIILKADTSLLWVGLFLVVLSVVLFIDAPSRLAGYVSELQLWRFGVKFRKTRRIDEIQPPQLTDQELNSRRRVANKLSLPDDEVPEFNLVEHSLAIEAIPRSDPLVPMYFLDNHFRIVDWNMAFSLAFDRSMEGRRGMSVREWVFFLENYEDVLNHGEEAFGPGRELPTIDVEEIRYTSRRYGPLLATKRAYQVPDDDGNCLGWLTTLEATFSDDARTEQFHLDAIREMHEDLVWSEYSLYYDQVLLNTSVYPELLETLVGPLDEEPAVPPGAIVLDLGAGTGNLTLKLAAPGMGRIVFAMENNRDMLRVLRRKCKNCKPSLLRTDNKGPGVIAIKQDVNSLYGLPNDYFDCVFLNNVTYSLDDPVDCLRDVCRVLKPGGEIRLSGPQKKTRLDKVLKRIRRDLEKRGRFGELESQYHSLVTINRLYLEPDLHRWTVDDVQQQLLTAGFSKVTYKTDRAYAEQSMIVCARK